MRQMQQGDTFPYMLKKTGAFFLSLVAKIQHYQKSKISPLGLKMLPLSSKGFSYLHFPSDMCTYISKTLVDACPANFTTRI